MSGHFGYNVDDPQASEIRGVVSKHAYQDVFAL